MLSNTGRYQKEILRDSYTGCLAAHPRFSEMPQSCFIVEATAFKEYPLGPLLQYFFPRFAGPWTLRLPRENRI